MSHSRSSIHTGFVDLFGRETGALPVVRRIEIPIIQRDYAQGRLDPGATRVREAFLDALAGALLGDHPIELDFIYGDVEQGTGTFRPLDGQQRLTTLFLLHWYLALRTGRLTEPHLWKHFTYATRPGAELFCQRLVEVGPPPEGVTLVGWIQDQHWFHIAWQHDPTVEGMLVMIAALEARLRPEDWEKAWGRLVDPRQPAISFHLLPLAEGELDADLYIKMNSRGRPLTEFENFKALFERTISEAGHLGVEAFAQKIDGTWMEVFWKQLGLVVAAGAPPVDDGHSQKMEDARLDAAVMNYFGFVADIRSWWGGGGRVSPSLEDLVPSLFGAGRGENFAFLVASLDAWVDPAAWGLFAEHLVSAEQHEHAGERLVPSWEQSEIDTNLLSVCCNDYGAGGISLRRTLLLFAFLLHRVRNTPEFRERLRVLRNVLAGSVDRLREPAMGVLVAEVAQWIEGGSLEALTSFNPVQVEDERRKLEFLERCPELRADLVALENHTLLQGYLAVFDLSTEDPERFRTRAAQFARLFDDPALRHELTGALLAKAPYGLPQRSHWRFGSPGKDNKSWRYVFTEEDHAGLAKTREALGQLLDEVSAWDGPAVDALKEIQQRWLKTFPSHGPFDWRWYFVRYGEMRRGAKGRYASEDGRLGYRLCMLEGERLSGKHFDPFLSAIAKRIGTVPAVFQGGVELERWLRLAKSQIGLRCISEGFQLDLPPSVTDPVLPALLRKHGVGDDRLLRVSQVEVGGVMLDTEDRVVRGAQLLEELLGAGF